MSQPLKRSTSAPRSPKLFGLLLVTLFFAALACNESGIVGNDCTIDTDCIPTAYCDTETNTCQFRDAQSCQRDQDCFGDKLCSPETDTCLESCVNASTCEFDGDRCLPSSNGQNLCFPPDVSPFNDCTPENQGEDCAARQICDPDTLKCFDPSTVKQYRYITLEDTTSSDGACGVTGSKADPGSDIYEVRLVNATGQVIAWAQAVEEFDDPSTPSPEGASPAILDGRPSGAATPSCPKDGTSLDNDQVYAMSCRGKLKLQFLNASGKQVNIQETDRLEVFEYGPNCGGSGDDRYSAFLCEDTSQASQVNNFDCNVELGRNGSGRSSWNVKFP